MFINNVFTPLRVLNLIKIGVSYLLKLRKPFGVPTLLMIEPTNFCNLKCQLCPTGQNVLRVPKGMLQLVDFINLIDRQANYLTCIYFWMWGEPLLNNNIGKMVKYAKEKRIYTELSTNANIVGSEDSMSIELVESGLDKLVVSVDGITEESYRLFREGGELGKVVSFILALVAAKQKLKSKSPYIDLQFIIHRGNESEVGAVEKFARNLGVDGFSIKTLDLGISYLDSKDSEKNLHLLPIQMNFGRYIKLDNNFKIKKQENYCKRLWATCVVNWDGELSVCCNDPHRKISLGNVFRESLSSLWTTKNYQALRQNLKSNDFCKNCTGSLNREVVAQKNFNKNII